MGTPEAGAIETLEAEPVGTPMPGTEPGVTSSDFGDRLVPIPLSVLRWNVQEQHFVLNMAQDLNEAPSFAPDALPDTQETGWDAEISDFWGAEGTSDGNDSQGTQGNDNDQGGSSNTQ